MKAETEVKSLDVKILELRENPDNLHLLFDIMAQVFQYADEIESGSLVIKDLDVVHYILANSLKANLIKHQQLGLVFYYLMTVKAPSIYY